MATLAIPELRDEGSGGNAGASRRRIGRHAGFAPFAGNTNRLGKERIAENLHIFGVRPIPFINRIGLLFFWREEIQRTTK